MAVANKHRPILSITGDNENANLNRGKTAVLPQIETAITRGTKASAGTELGHFIPSRGCNSFKIICHGCIVSIPINEWMNYSLVGTGFQDVVQEVSKSQSSCLCSWVSGTRGVCHQPHKFICCSYKSQCRETGEAYAKTDIWTQHWSSLKNKIICTCLCVYIDIDNTIKDWHMKKSQFTEKPWKAPHPGASSISVILCLGTQEPWYFTRKLGFRPVLIAPSRNVTIYGDNIFTKLKVIKVKSLGWGFNAVITVPMKEEIRTETCVEEDSSKQHSDKQPGIGQGESLGWILSLGNQLCLNLDST